MIQVKKTRYRLYLNMHSFCTPWRKTPTSSSHRFVASYNIRQRQWRSLRYIYRGRNDRD